MAGVALDGRPLSCRDHKKPGRRCQRPGGIETPAITPIGLVFVFLLRLDVEVLVEGHLELAILALDVVGLVAVVGGVDIVGFDRAANPGNLLPPWRPARPRRPLSTGKRPMRSSAQLRRS